MGKLKEQGLFITQRDDWTVEQKIFLENYFKNEVIAVLTPLSMQELEPCPLLPGRHLNVAVNIQSKKAGETVKKIVIIPVPVILDRFVQIPSEQSVSYALLEDIIADNARLLFEEWEILGSACVRITRDADVTVQADEAADLLGMIEQAVLERRRRMQFALKYPQIRITLSKVGLLAGLSSNLIIYMKLTVF